MTFLSTEDMDFISSLLQEDIPENPLSVSNQEKPLPKGIDQKSKGKCTELYIGGTDMKTGMTTSVTNHCSCSSLFCISCDFPVIRFEDRRWDGEVPYLFLRNHYPHSVQTKLKVAKGYCAYCCQCRSVDTNKELKLNPFSGTWVCKGH